MMTAKEFLHQKGVTNNLNKSLIVLRGEESFDMADLMQEFAKAVTGNRCKIEVKQEGHLLNGLWLWDYSYSLDESAFTEEDEQDIRTRTGLERGSLGDWWVNHPGSRTKSWKELIQLAIGILECDATEKFVNPLYIDQLKAFSIKDIPTTELPQKSVSGAKRVNATCIEYHTSTDIETLPLFILYGKEEGCCIEGTWLDWCMFACNILASKNTELACPELYAPGLANHNY